MKSIVSLREIEWRLACPIKRLREIAYDIGSHYRVWLEKQGRGRKAREIQAPSAELKRLQRRIVKNILSEFDLPAIVHGAVKGRSTRTNAEAHIGADIVVNVDVTNFFPSVQHRRVFNMYRQDLYFGEDVSWLLTKLTTFKGRLPTGAPTSPTVANALLAFNVDRPLEAWARSLGVTYTRYVDDLTFSGPQARQLINEAALLLSNLNLSIRRDRKKLKIVRNSSPQWVTGLLVNSDRVSVGRERVGRVKAAIHQLPALPVSERPAAIRSIRGRINHVRQYNAGASARLARQLESCLQGS